MLYKYRAIENEEQYDRLKSIIEDSTLWAASIESLNDPFEGYFDDLIRKTTQAFDINVLQRRMEIVRNFSIVSLSKEPDNILLWSHYAVFPRSVLRV